MKDIKKLCDLLKEKFGIGIVQIHLHGHPLGSTPNIDRHAHIIFNWMDEKTGKSIKLDKLDLMELQLMVKNHLEELQQRKSFLLVKNKISFGNLYNRMPFYKV